MGNVSPKVSAAPEWLARIAEVEKEEGRPICGAKTRSGEPCRRSPMRGTGYSTPYTRPRCRTHGGKSLRGVASPSWKHGQMSYAVPRGLADRYQLALNDPDYLSLKSEIALTVARLQELLDRVDTGESQDAWVRMRQIVKQVSQTLTDASAKVDDPDAVREDLDKAAAALDEALAITEAGLGNSHTWKEIHVTADLMRKLKTADRQRLQALHQAITADRGLALVTRLLEILRARADRETLRLVMEDVRTQGLIRSPEDLDRELEIDEVQE